MNNDVTVILTSCGRWDLLRRTVKSFLKFNTYPVKDIYVYNDGGAVPVDFALDFTNVKFLWEDDRKGQIYALDFLWSQVTTPYAFTCEDDWEFTREGFIEASMAVLEDDPKILMAWLIHPEPHNQHPVEWGPKYGVLKTHPNLWSGTRFNPALKRKSDYDLIAPFSKHTMFNRNKPWKAEADISKVYWKLGFKGVILPHVYMKHIGENRRVI